MRHRFSDDPDADDARADDFRCPGCETPTGTGRYCADCREALFGPEEDPDATA